MLQHAGVDGFLANSDQRYEQADVETAAWEAFLLQVTSVFWDEPFTTSQLWEKLNERAPGPGTEISTITERAGQLRARPYRVNFCD